MRNLIRYNPRGLSLFDDIDRVFRTFLNDSPAAVYRSPKVDIRESDGEYEHVSLEQAAQHRRQS